MRAQISQKQASKPSIVPRDLQFHADVSAASSGMLGKQKHYWVGGDAVRTAVFNALSISFPKGEAMFIRSVNVFRGDVPPALAAEIRAFSMQEAYHNREHDAFNTLVEDSGYNLSHLYAELDRRIAIIERRSPYAALACTMALEHYTAILGKLLLSDPRFLEGADTHTLRLWQWHAMEEIEHKSVAYDTWLSVTRHWSPLKRWGLRSATMLLVSYHFLTGRGSATLNLLRQDGLKGPRIWWRLLSFCFGKTGILRQISRPLLSYFIPGFHPSHHDDSAILTRAALMLSLDSTAK